MVKKSIFFILLFLAFTMVTSANADTLPVAMTTETVYTDKEVNFEYKVLAAIDYSELYSEFNLENMHVMPKLLTIGDLNMDGIKDIIIHHDSITSDGTGQAIDAQSSLVFFISNGAGGFVKNPSLFESIPTRVTVREGIVADFNGDGRNDFFGAAHGVDGLAIGEQNILMLSTPQATLTDVSYTHLPLQIDFSHGAGAGDIDNDGDLDIFIANNQSLAKIDAYFLINNGTGTFTKDDSPSRISPSLIKFSEINSGSNSMYLTAKFFDMNGDNAVDLLLASHEVAENYENYDEFYYSRLIYNDGNGRFFTYNTVEFPPGGYGVTTLTTDIDPLDINGDGNVDLILTQSDFTSIFSGQYHQALINNGTGGFVDQTAEVIPYQNFSDISPDLAPYPNQTFLNDLNLDGNLDIIVNGLEPIAAEGSKTATRVYMNDGNGKFLPLPNEKIYSGPGWVGMDLSPIDIDADGDVDLVGINYSGNPTTGWDLVLFENKTFTKEYNCTSQGFDKEYYLAAKLAQLQSVDPAIWGSYTPALLETLLVSYGFTAESHYSQYGYLEGLAPNQYFNHSEYILAKATALCDAGLYASIEEATAAFNAAWTGDAYLHYLVFGAAEGINPSNDFDESSYLTDKLAALQASGVWLGKTIDGLRSFLASLNMTALDHYLNYGWKEGLSVTPVPVSERVKE